MTDRPISPGSPVILHFSLSLVDGTEAFTTAGDEPFSLVMGDGSLREGMELALYGLRAGDKQTLTLTPDQAFGKRDESNVHSIPHNEFDPELDLEPGLVIAFETPSGEELPGTIIDFDTDSVNIDFNHPLAGQDVVFRVEILNVGNQTSTTDS